MSILSRTGTDTNDFILLRGTGTESLMMKVETDTGCQSPQPRTNYNEANYAFLFGERNHIYSGASGSGAFGGKIYIYGENTYGLGYHVYNFSNQALVGGYDVGNTAVESLIWGNTIGIDCTHDSNTHSWDNSNTSSTLGKYIGVIGKDIFIGIDAKASFITGIDHRIGNYFYGNVLGGQHHALNRTDIQNNAIFGYSHNIGRNFKFSLVSGRGHQIGNYVDHSIITGQEQHLGNYCVFVNVFGGINNSLGNYVTDCTIFGYLNEIAAGTSSSYRSDIYLFGAHLKANKSNLVAFGKYNVSTSDSIFEIGAGSSDSSRKNAFRVGYNSTDGYFLCINNVKLTATKLQQLIS